MTTILPKIKWQENSWFKIGVVAVESWLRQKQGNMNRDIMKLTDEKEKKINSKAETKPLLKKQEKGREEQS